MGPIAGREHADATVSMATNLFRKAVVALDQGATYSLAGDAARRADCLHDSVCSMVDAFLAVRGRSVTSDGQRAELMGEHPVLGRVADNTLLEVLSLDKSAAWTSDRISTLADLEKRYRTMLPALRSSLASELPAYQGAIGVLKALVRHPAVKTIPAVAAMLALLLAAHQVINPAYHLELGGQIFWKQSPGEAFTEQRSRSFDVKVDGRRHKYVIDLDNPVTVSMLRIDPVDKADATHVDIHRVELLGADGQRQDIFHSADRPSWDCRNCRWLTGNEDALSLQPVNNDPFVVGPAFPPVAVAGVEVEMRARADKSFWQWVTRLEKSYE